MSVDKLVDSTQLDSDLTSVANAIRAKSGGSSQLAFPAGFVSEIQSIVAGGGANERLLASGTYTVTAAQSSITIATNVAAAAKTTKALVVGDLTSASSGFMKYFSVVYVNEPQALKDAVGQNYPKCRYYNSAATGGGVVNYQSASASTPCCYISANKEIVCRQWSANYKIQPATFSWYIWGEAEA